MAICSRVASKSWPAHGCKETALNMDFSVLNLELAERPALSVRDDVLPVEKRVHQHGRAVGAVPVEGKMHLLMHLGAEEQRKRHLTPLANSATRSCFAMTEPAPGAGFQTLTLRHRRAIARSAFCRRGTATR